MTPFLNKITLPLTAILCAVLMWFFVTLDKNFETTLTLPIKVINVPKNLKIAGPVPKTAQVVVSGSGRHLLLLQFSKAHLFLNRDNAKRGPVTFELTGKNVRLGGETKARVLYVKSPQKIPVIFDAAISKSVRVVPDVKIELDKNMIMMGEPILTPNRVMANGPRRVVARLESLFTQIVEIENLTADTQFFAFIRRPEEFEISVKPNKVRVKIEVETLKKRVLTDIPIRLINVPRGVPAELSAKSVSLVIAGPERDVEIIKKSFVNVFVKYTRFSVEQLTEVEPTVSIIGNVQWSNLEPPTVRLIRR